MNPIKLFIERPIFTSMLIVTLVVFGLYSYPRLGVDNLPDTERPVLTITTVLPGADPGTVETQVSEPLEEALNTLPGLDKLRSVSLENVSQVVVQFKLERRLDAAAQDVRDRVQATLSKLPAEIHSPVVEKFDFGAAPVMVLALSGPLPIERLTAVAEDVVKPAIQQISGVGAVDLLGGRKREIQIVFDLARLRAHGMTPAEAVQTLKTQNVDVPGGRTLEGQVERTIKLAAEVHTIEELRQMVLASAPDGSTARLRDVAQVTDGVAEARSLARLGTAPAIGLQIRKQSGTNTVQVAEAIKQSLSRVSRLLPQGTRIEMVNDGSSFIRASINAVNEDMLLGGVLAVAVVLVFLRSWRSTLVSAVALPVSVVGTFAAMKAFDFTFNIVTMIGLTLSIGLLIDDAIVVIENIARHLEGGETPVEAARRGTAQIALAVLAVTLSVVAVFVPVAFMEGIVGRIFFQFGVTVAVAVLISYFVSMTLTPMLSARVLKEHQVQGPIGRGIERVQRGIERGYLRILGWMIDHRALTMAGAVVILAASVAMARGLSFSFIPEQDQSAVMVSVEMPAGTRLDATRRQLDDLTRQLGRIAGVTSTFATAGGGAQAEANKGEILVNLVPIGKRHYSQGDFKAYLRERLRALRETNIGIADVAGVSSGGGKQSRPIQFNLRHKDPKVLAEAVQKVMAAMRKNPGFTDVDSTWRTGKPELDVQVDRSRAAALGVPAGLLGQQLRTLLGRDKLARFREGGETYDIRATLPAEVLADPMRLGALQVRSPTRQMLELRALANMRPGEGPSMIERQAMVRQVTVLADLRSYSLSEAMEFLEGVASRELPAGVQHGFDGQGGELGTALRGFLSAFVLGVLLLYIILAAQFESLVHPVAIMMALPFAVIGALGSLLLARQPMSIFAMIGIIMLMGLVAKNGILLVEFTNQLRNEGKTTREALLAAGPIRLRPILMTTVAMIAGMIPVALARGEGAVIRVPMGISVIGGLITSTVLTLGVVPVIYSLLDDMLGRAARLTARHAHPQRADSGPPSDLEPTVPAD